MAVLACWSVRLESAPVQGVGAPEGLAGQSAAEGTQGAALAPFLNIVPTSDGELWIHAEGTGPLAGTVYANLDLGAGHHKGGWTMTYSETLRGYVTPETVAGLSPAQDDYGSLSISTTLGLNSGPVHFERYYVPHATPRALPWPDGALELEVVSGDTFSTDAYVAVAPSWGLPRPAPLGHRLASQVYSVRASGALQDANRPLLLRLYIQDDLLAGADPHTLAVFRWDAGEDRWSNQGGTLFTDRGYLSLAIRRLTSYALMSTPTWTDTFDDHTGLSERSNVGWGGSAEDLALVLAGSERYGYAVSVPISAPTGTRWESVRYGAAVDPPTVTLSVDLLRPDGTLVRRNLPAGADLGDLETGQHPALALRANFSSTVAGESPALYDWQLAWNAEAHTCYLPLIQARP
jgi:hypothetical protein